MATNETVQTVQTDEEPDEKRPAYFEIASDGKAYHWMLWSGNGRRMAMSVDGYNEKKHCVRAINYMKKALQRGNQKIVTVHSA